MDGKVTQDIHGCVLQQPTIQFGASTSIPRRMDAEACKDWLSSKVRSLATLTRRNENSGCFSKTLVGGHSSTMDLSPSNRYNPGQVTSIESHAATVLQASALGDKTTVPLPGTVTGPMQESLQPSTLLSACTPTHGAMRSSCLSLVIASVE